MARVILTLVIFWVAAGAASAQMVERNYQAMMQVRQSHAFPVLDDADHLVGVAEFRGLAIFDNGEVAVHRYVGWFDMTKGSGEFSGYALWTFDDGSSLRAPYSGSANDIGPTNFGISANVRDITGTGRYEGASGSGTFAGRRLEPIDVGGSTYLLGTLSIAK